MFMGVSAFSAWVKGSGRKAYSRYVKAAEKLVRGRGGAILWAGIIEGVALSDETDTDWDRRRPRYRRRALSQSFSRNSGSAWTMRRASRVEATTDGEDEAVKM